MRAVLQSLAAGLALAILAATFPVEACRGQILINEILADPAHDWNGDGTYQFRDDEWVEVVNAGSEVADLGGFYLTDATESFRFGFSGSLEPGGIRLVYGSDSVAWESAHGASTVGLSLNNAGDTVRLFRVSGADTLLVDAHAYGSHEGLDERSTGRLPDAGTTWVVFDALNPYTGTTEPLGSGCAPTPGTPNGCPLPLHRSTWGRVKQLYAPPAWQEP
jgi:hypothetical protein